jgi:hypothetical protein
VKATDSLAVLANLLASGCAQIPVRFHGSRSQLSGGLALTCTWGGGSK